MKKILLLTDFSEVSRHTLRFASEFFKEFACDFLLLNCYTTLPQSTEVIDHQLQQSAEQRLDADMTEIRERDGPSKHSFRRKAVGANLYNVVSELQEEEGFDLITVGATGSGESVRLGSVATEIIRSATCPVLVVPAKAEVEQSAAIVVATDYLNFESVETFLPVKELVKATTPPLLFLTVLDENSSKQTVDSSRQLLLDEYFKDHSPLHYLTIDDSAAEGIEEFLSTRETQLLVTISHHRSLWDVLLNRSTSRILAYQAKVPLLVLTESVPDPLGTSLSVDLSDIL